MRHKETNTTDDIVVLNEKNGNVEHVVNKANGDAAVVDNGDVDDNTDDCDGYAENITDHTGNFVHNEDSPSVKSNSESNCHIISAEIHNENDVTACVLSRDSVLEDEESDDSVIVDIVNSKENKYAVNGDMIKRASHVSYKEHAKNRVSMLIHRHTL